MSEPDFDKEQLLALIAEVLDGRLGDVDRESLNDVLRESPEARQFYRKHMELHARLHLEYTGGQSADFMPSRFVSRRQSWFSRRRLLVAAAVACLTLIVGIALLQKPEPLGETREFATVESSRAARWDSSNLPTTVGSRLTKGTLRLAEGLVTLRFDSGAQVTLEAPAELILVDPMNCTLANGIVVAEIPDSAVGFRIATPSANVVDYGTRFSVIVDAATGETHTQVYEGLVEVEHPQSGEIVSLKSGQLNSADEKELREALDGANEPMGSMPLGPPMREPDWTLLETTQDAYIGISRLKGKEVHRSQTLLLVKNGIPHRKTYLGFHLAGIDPARIVEAELILRLAPTGWGLASHVPDATFSVYGLLRKDLLWSEESITEETAPANVANQAGLVNAEVQKLGSFLIEQGVQRSQIKLQGESLVAFVRAHAGSNVTLILARDTAEIEDNGLVHGFASRRHPTLPAPTLAIRLTEVGD